MLRYLPILASLVASPVLAAESRLPNIVILFADDLGYGDLGCYGHPTIRTPNLDRMAAEGLRFTQFYSAAPVCTPSRTALLTGRLPVRSGMCEGVLFPNSARGLPADEVTIAEILKPKGYATGCFGKWHLGHLPPYLPTRQGFDYYFGIPYSNDMGRGRPTGGVPLLRDEQIIEDPVVLDTLTPRYADEAIAFIRANQTKPFFVYLPYTFPHVPLAASDRFRGKSPRGLYGDVVEELDLSVGKVIAALKDMKLDDNTLVFFSSDNGPWLPKGLDGGSAGLLRDGKGTTWEGGMREPGIAWWPGRIKPAVTTALASTLDMLPTVCRLAGAPLPGDRALDGYDMTPILFDSGASLRNTMFFYRRCEVAAYRRGPYKIHLATTSPEQKGVQVHDPPLLFNLEQDPSERFNIADKHPELVAEMLKEVAAHKASFTPGPDQISPRLPKPGTQPK